MDGNPRLPHREDRLVVQHRRAHVGELAELAVGQHLDGARVVDDARVGHQQARDVGPVLVDIGTGAASHDGPGDVGASAGEGLDRAVRQRSVEAGDHGAGGTCQPIADGLLGPLGVEAALGIEVDDVGRIHEFVAQQIRHDEPVQVLAAAGRVVLAGTRRELLADLVQVGVQVQAEAQIRG